MIRFVHFVRPHVVEEQPIPHIQLREETVTDLVQPITGGPPHAALVARLVGRHILKEIINRTIIHVYISLENG